jgi:hypothetical protein
MLTALGVRFISSAARLKLPVLRTASSVSKKENFIRIF